MSRDDASTGVAAWVARLVPARDRDVVLGDLSETARAESWSRGRFVAELAAVAAGYQVARLTGRLRRPATAGAVLHPRRGEGMTMAGWWYDTRLATRALLRRPALAATLAGTLAMGIGANTAIFSLLRGAVWWDLPYQDPGRLVMLSDAPRSGSSTSGWSQSLPNALDLRERTPLLGGLEVWMRDGGNLSGGERPERVRGLAVGPDFLDVLGVTPALGRDFHASDNRAEAEPTLLLSHALWRDAFGSDPAVVGRTVELDAVPHRILGVLPSTFEFRPDPAYLVSLRYDGDPTWTRGRNWFYSVGRMRPGVDVEDVRRHAASVYAELARAWPDMNENRVPAVQPIRDFLVPSTARSTLTLALGAVALVLVLACLNVANLLVVRSEGMRRELAVRMALGAGRGRLYPTFLAEGLVVAAAGAVLGVAVAYAVLPGLVAVYGPGLPRAAQVAVDGRVLGATLALTLLVGLGVGLVPALRNRRRHPAAALREGARRVSPAGRRMRTAMVVAESGLATVLVAGAALLARSYAELASVDPGLDRPQEVLVAQVSLSNGRYPDRDARVRFFDELLSRLHGLPGVRAVGTTSRLPLNGGNNVGEARVPGRPGSSVGPVEVRWTSPGFFEAAGLRIVAGRGPVPADARDGRYVVVSETLARGLFGDPVSALGGRLVTDDDQDPLTVVGVASDLRDVGVRRDPPAGIYYPYGPATASGGYAVLVLRAAGDPLDLAASVRAAVAEVDATLPLHGVERLDEVVRRSTAAERSSTTFFALFALLALGLGAVGIYAVMAYTVTERTPELGLRMALGARSGTVMGRVVRAGLARAGAGVALGVVAALLTGRYLESRLYGVEVGDPATHAAVAFLLLAVAAGASWLPARRAAAVDPVEALRHE